MASIGCLLPSTGWATALLRPEWREGYFQSFCASVAQDALSHANHSLDGNRTSDTYVHGLPPSSEDFRRNTCGEFPAWLFTISTLHKGSKVNDARLVFCKKCIMLLWKRLNTDNSGTYQSIKCNEYVADSRFSPVYCSL